MKPDAARALIAAGETLAVEFKGEEHAPLTAPGIFPLRSIGCSATRPPTCASAASSRSNRSRWCCNMWKSTAGSRDVRRRSCAESGLTRPRDC